MTAKKMANQVIGDAGEYYVAFRLAKMGISCAMVSKGSNSVDILGTVDGSRSVSIQVKTTAWPERSLQWDFGKNMPVESDSFYFVFVNIWREEHDENKPEILVAPSKRVGEYVKGGVRPQFRITKEAAEPFRDKWDPIKKHLFSTSSCS